jgi:hypothetical protein
MDWTFLTGALAIVFLLVALFADHGLWALGVSAVLIVATVAGLVGATRK